MGKGGHSFYLDNGTKYYNFVPIRLDVFSLEIEVYLPGKLHLLRVIEDNSAYLNYWK